MNETNATFAEINFLHGAKLKEITNLLTKAEQENWVFNEPEKMIHLLQSANEIYSEMYQALTNDYAQKCLEYANLIKDYTQLSTRYRQECAQNRSDILENR